MAVLRDGKKVGELSGEQLNQADIMKTIAGGESVQSEVKLDEEVAENGAAV
jgi:simple sugar transport system ATP-binding protein